MKVVCSQIVIDATRARIKFGLPEGLVCRPFVASLELEVPAKNAGCWTVGATYTLALTGDGK